MLDRLLTRHEGTLIRDALSKLEDVDRHLAAGEIMPAWRSWEHAGQLARAAGVADYPDWINRAYDRMAAIYDAGG